VLLNRRIRSNIAKVISLAISLNSFLNYLLQEFYVLLGLIVIILFIYDNFSFKFLRKTYLDLSDKKSIQFLVIFYTCIGFLATIYNPLSEFIITIIIVIIVIPLFTWAFTFKKYFKFLSGGYLNFWDKTFLGNDTVFEYVDEINKLPKSALKTIQIKISESVPTLLLAVTILVFIPIGMILSLNSAFFLSLILYPFIKKLFKRKIKTKEKQKTSMLKIKEYEKTTVNFIEQFFTHKGLIGTINFLFAYIFIGYNFTYQIFLFFSFSIEGNIFDSLLFLSIDLYIPALFFILLYTYKLSKRYKYFIDTWYKKNIDEISKTTKISIFEDLGVIISFSIIIIVTVLFQFYSDFNRYSHDFILLQIFAIFIWFSYIFLIIKSLKKFSNKIKNKEIIKDNIRLPIIGAFSVITFASYNNFDVFLLSISIIFVYGFYILDLYVYIKNKDIRYDKQIIILLMPLIFILILLYFSSPYYLINIVCVIGIIMMIFFIIIECLSFKLLTKKI
jgi:hypothetical protein